MVLPWSPKPMTGVRFANLLPFQHERVLDIGTGRGLQNLDNVGPIPTSLSKFSNGSVDKLDIVTSLSRRNLWVQSPPELPFIGVW